MSTKPFSLVTRVGEPCLLFRRGEMQMRFFLLFLISPISLETCCPGIISRELGGIPVGIEQSATHQFYRVVAGEIFAIPCVDDNVVWSRTGGGSGRNKVFSLTCGENITVEAKHSGNYTSPTGKMFLHLQVVERASWLCDKQQQSEVLQLYRLGRISCPGLNCTNNTDVTWYNGGAPGSKLQADTCTHDGVLHICTVHENYAGVYFCDRLIHEDGVKWIFRRPVNVTVIQRITTSKPPWMTAENKTEEVEFGQDHNLTCEAYFPFEVGFTPDVQLFVNYGGNMMNMAPLDMERPETEMVESGEFKVTRRALLRGLTPQHLNNSYTCIARNTVGNCSLTIKLKEKIKVKWPSLVGYPIASLLLVAVVGVVVHVKWLELKLIYKFHNRNGQFERDEKDFDVFLSYVWSPPSAAVEEGFNLPSSLEPDTGLEELLTSEERRTIQRPIEVLLPQVLEHVWRYRLYLMERDPVPGGAYTNDVVHAIQRSQMLICVLSADYLSNSNAVFVLESGLQALLQNSSLRLMLIKTGGISPPFPQLDPPLPSLVQRALKVLPTVKWAEGKPERAKFWRSLKRALPNHRVDLIPLTEKQ